MTQAATRPRKHLQAPPGCEGYFTRQQAAHALGFASEFKIRELERRGMLHAVRGPMRAAFYPRAEVLAVKAQLALNEPGRVPPEAWSDAELLALLSHPKRSGEVRTVLDLVLETQISIERAQHVCEFWQRCEPTPRSGGAGFTQAAPAPPIAAPTTSSGTHVSQERRDAQRLSRDSLIRNLRDPDPRVREQAFAHLKEGQRG
jgi:hypothetical protein